MRSRFSRRASPSASAKSNASRATPVSSATARRSELPIDAEPRADVIVLDLDRRALRSRTQLATAVLRRRQPRGQRRPQYSRAGDFRQADRLRPAHAELPRNRRDVHRQRRGDSGAVRIGDLDDAILGLVRDPACIAPASARRRARSSKRTGGAKEEDAHQRSAISCRPPGQALGATSGQAPAWCTEWPTRSVRSTARPPRGGASGTRSIPSAVASSNAPSSASATSASAAAARRRSSSTSRACSRMRGHRPRHSVARARGRKFASEGVTVVSDGYEILAGVDTSGDEPLMLARALQGTGVSVVVGYQSLFVRPASPRPDSRRHGAHPR